MSMRPYSNRPRSCPCNAARRYHCRARLRSGGCFVAYTAAKLLHAAGSGERRIQARAYARAALSSLLINDVWLTVCRSAASRTRPACLPGETWAAARRLHGLVRLGAGMVVDHSQMFPVALRIVQDPASNL